MRAALAAAILAVGMSVPAAAQTDPAIVPGIGWDDCLNLIEEYVDAYSKRKGQVLSEIDQPNIRSAAVEVGKEIIVLRCEKRFWSSTFTIVVAPL